MSTHLTEREVATRCKLSVRTLQRWRYIGMGPSYLKLGGRIVYRLSDVEAWEERCHSERTSDK
jgi:predicted DNA-binding transcriptional regulator AlpA